MSLFNYMTKLLLVVSTLLLLGSCKKEAGFGGRSSITGKVWVDDYTPGGNLEASGYTGNINVYIGVEGANAMLKSVDTDYKGSYEFIGLQKGIYKVWVYTECDTCTDNATPIIQTVTIDKAKDEKQLTDFKVRM